MNPSGTACRIFGTKSHRPTATLCEKEIIALLLSHENAIEFVTIAGQNTISSDYLIST